MIKKIIFIFSIILIFCSAIFFRHFFALFYFQNDLNPITLNVELKKSDSEEIYICYNKICDLMKCKNGICGFKAKKDINFYKGKIQEIEMVLDNKTTDKIRSIALFDGMHSTKEFQIPELINTKINFLNSSKIALKIPYKDNAKPLISRLGIYFESIFYNWFFYILSYALILIYLIKYQERFEFKIKYPIILILLLGLFLRLSHINFIPLWNDELYSWCFISNMASGLNLKRAFLDPGNPPLFFIISNMWLYFFHKSVVLMRLLPCIIGVIQIWVIYFVLEKILNKKTALIGAFLSAINIYIIMESNEIRSYILSMTLVSAELYLFYKLKNEYTKTNSILYYIVSILLINTHYYCVLYVLSNFILGEILFKNKRIQFLICNFIAFLTFLPYFINNIKTSILPEFNNWLKYPDISLLSDHITFYFGNLIFFIVCIIFCIFVFKKLSKKEKFVFLYCSGSIALVFAFALIISLFIKPVLFERYFCIFLPFLIINNAIFLNIDFKTKYNPLIHLIIFLFAINMPKYETFNLYCNINPLVNYFIQDSKTDREYEANLVIPDTKYYANYYKIQKDKVIIADFERSKDADLIEQFLSKIPENNKKILLYVPEMRTNSKLRDSKDKRIKKIDTNMVPIYKIYIN